MAEMNSPSNDSDGTDAAALRSVQERFGLPTPALVEKDFYVLKALAALAAIDTAPLRLVLGGGTALSRAYRLIQRMSRISIRIAATPGKQEPHLQPSRFLRGELVALPGHRGGVISCRPKHPAKARMRRTTSSGKPCSSAIVCGSCAFQWASMIA